MATEKVQIAKTRLVIDGSDVKNTVKDLSKTARDLRNELKGMEKGTDEYIKASQNLNKVEHRLQEVKGEIKDVGKEWKMQQEDWKKGFSDMVGNINIFGVRLGDLASKFGFVSKAVNGASGALKLLKIALISTGIGAILVAVGTLITYFTRMQSGIDFVSKAMAALKAPIDVIIDRIAMFGEGLFKILSGDFKEGFKQLGDSFKGIGEEIRLETVLAWQLQEALISVTKAENDLILQRAATRAEVKELNKIAEDVTRSYEERGNAARRAIAIEQELVEKQISTQKKKAANLLGLLDLTDEKLEEIRVNGLKLSDVGFSESTEEDRKAAIQELAAIFQLQEQSLKLQTTLQNKLNIIQQQQIAQWQAQRDAAMKELEKFGELDKAQSDARISIIEQENDERKRLLRERVDAELSVINERQMELDRQADLDRQRAEVNKMINDELKHSMFDLVGSTAGMLAQDEQNRKKNAELIKGFSIAKVMTDMYEEIQAIWKWANANPANLLFPGSANIIAGIKTAAALVRGKMAVSNIAKQKFAGGGYTGPGFGYADDSGYKPAGIVHEHEYVVPKWMTQDSVVQPVISWLENKRLRGYAMGGDVVAPSMDADMIQKTVSQMAGMIPNKIEAYITYDKIEATRNEMNNIKRQRSI